MCMYLCVSLSVCVRACMLGYSCLQEDHRAKTMLLFIPVLAAGFEHVQHAPYSMACLCRMCIVGEFHWNLNLCSPGVVFADFHHLDSFQITAATVHEDGGELTMSFTFSLKMEVSYCCALNRVGRGCRTYIPL